MSVNAVATGNRIGHHVATLIALVPNYLAPGCAAVGVTGGEALFPGLFGIAVDGINLDDAAVLVPATGLDAEAFLHGTRRVGLLIIIGGGNNLGMPEGLAKALHCSRVLHVRAAVGSPGPFRRGDESFPRQGRSPLSRPRITNDDHCAQGNVVPINVVRLERNFSAFADTLYEVPTSENQLMRRKLAKTIQFLMDSKTLAEEKRF